MKTNSWAFPNIFDVAHNEVGILADDVSVVNRSRLLILTEPTEIYNEPDQGVGLKRHLWQYNNDNQKAIIKDRIVEQLRLHEPQVNPDSTEFADGLLFTGTTPEPEEYQNFNKLEMTIGLQTKFGSTIKVDINATNF